MPFGISWLTYSKYWGAALAGFVCGSQLVHNFYKPLDGLEEMVDIEYEKMKKLMPPPTIEDRVARYDEMHQKLEEYEKNREPWKLPQWFTKYWSS